MVTDTDASLGAKYLTMSPDPFNISEGDGGSLDLKNVAF
jgi:hypothetical protein